MKKPRHTTSTSTSPPQTDLLWELQKVVMHQLWLDSGSAPTFGNSISFVYGPQAFDAMEAAIKASTGWIGAAAYEWEPGSPGSRFAQVFADAVSRGRKVISIMDGFGSRNFAGRKSAELWRQMIDSGVDLRMSRNLCTPGAVLGKRLPGTNVDPMPRSPEPGEGPNSIMRGTTSFGWFRGPWGFHRKIFIASDRPIVGDYGPDAIAVICGNQFLKHWEEWRDDPVEEDPATRLPEVADYGVVVKGPAVGFWVVAFLDLMSKSHAVSLIPKRALKVLDRFLPDFGFRQLETEQHLTRVVGHGLGTQGVIDDHRRIAAGDVAGYLQERRNGSMQVLISSPTADPKRGTVSYLATNTLMRFSNGGAFIVSPLLNMPSEQVEKIREMRAQNIPVTILLNKVDPDYIRRAAVRQYEQLIEMGVEIYEYQPGRLHSKLALHYANLGGKTVPFALKGGSSNTNWRSAAEDQEADWVTYDADVIAQGARLANFYLERSTRVTPEYVAELKEQTTVEGRFNRKVADLVDGFT